MEHRVNDFSAFIKHTVHYALFVWEVFVGLLGLLGLGGVLISWVEDLPIGEAMYFAFITGLSIGYGDVTPETGWGRLISVCIGMSGMVFTGMTIAVATRALGAVVKERAEFEQ